MALTVTNTNTIQLLNILNRNSTAQSTTLQQLTTGKRITAGKDDPAGLIALSGLEAELRAVETSLTNNQRTDSMLTVADQAITEISSLLGEIESLVMATTSDANLTQSEIAANQSQVDDALTAIDRIVNTTNFNGKRLLDGSFGIQSTGVANARISGLRVFARSQSTSNQALTVTRVASAQVAEAAFQTAQSTGASLTTSGTTELAVAGTLGTVAITLVDGLDLTQIRDQINAATSQTGVQAVLSTTTHDAGTSAINFQSTTYGTDAFVSVEVLSGGAMNAASGTADNGQGSADDMQTISKTAGVDANITVNGQPTGTDGLDVSYSANGLSVDFTLATDWGRGAVADTTTTFTVLASGGATFQLGTTAATRATIGIDSLGTHKLGGGNGTARLSQLKSGGSADLRTDPGAALTAIREAIGEVASTRGRVGGFQKFQVGAAIASLQAAETGLSSAASVIGDTDFAIATSNLNRETVLIQAGVALLGVANQQSAQILSLL
jgi:flagellin